MSTNEMFLSMNAIYKYMYLNGPTHRNILRKNLILKGKVSSKDKFSKILDKMVASGRLIINKEEVQINPAVIKVGVLQRKGEEFYIVTSDSSKHYKVDKSILSAYKCGDLIEIVIEKNEEKNQVIMLGKCSKKHNNQPKHQEEEGGLVLGRVVKLSHDNLVFIPNKKSFSIRQIPILNDKEQITAFQDKLCLMKMVNLDAPLLGGYITEVKGEAGNPIHEYDAIAESYGAIMSWEGALIESEIEKIPTSVNISGLNLINEAEAFYKQKNNVVDLRDIPFVTVDPATCKDMDDAIYSRYDENGDVVCYIAVANVTKYVKLTSEIGKRYVKGGFTIYAPNKAYSILPSQLSTGICSLNPNEDRLAFVVKATIDKATGKVKSSQIYDAIINSKKKYSYEQAQQIVNENQDVVLSTYLQGKCMVGEPLTEDEQVIMNYYAGQVIKNGFERRKMIRFVSNNEREIVFDDDLQNVVDINPIEHLYYHEVIEAFMITANEATAKYAKDNNLDNIFRVHDEPNPKKTERANEFFNILGVDYDGDLSAEGTRSLIDLIKDTANEEVINNFLIKMQSRAVYSDHLYSSKKQSTEQDWVGERISHYALQSPHYSHTTSPIRRVPDYITQFNILANMHGTKPISAGVIEKIVEVANSRQIDVDQAEKDFEDINSVFYCEKHIGEKMSGRVVKIRHTSPEEGYEDDIVVIAKNEDKGVCVEIPLSEIIGMPSENCELSQQRCAVYDRKGNIVLTLCKPIEFIIESADRKTMRVVGKTNKEMVQHAEQKSHIGRQKYVQKQIINTGFRHKREKDSRAKRFESKRNHHSIQEEEIEL